MRVNRKGTDRTFCVYTLSIDNQVFYVGKTMGRFTDRLTGHRKQNSPVFNHVGNRINDVVFNVLDTFHTNQEASF
jgi:hypothetical protein